MSSSWGADARLLDGRGGLLGGRVDGWRHRRGWRWSFGASWRGRRGSGQRRNRRRYVELRLHGHCGWGRCRRCRRLRSLQRRRKAALGECRYITRAGCGALPQAGRGRDGVGRVRGPVSRWRGRWTLGSRELIAELQAARCLASVDVTDVIGNGEQRKADEGDGAEHEGCARRPSPLQHWRQPDFPHPGQSLNPLGAFGQTG